MGSPVVHFEITGGAPAGLQTFYGGLFGWAINTVPEMNYAIIDTQGGSGINGGIAASQQGSGGVTVYVGSDDLQASLDKAVSLGGTVVQEIMVIPGMLSLAMLADPAGNVIGLVGAAPDSEGGEQPGPSAGSGAPVSWFEIMGADAEALTVFYSALFGWEVSQYDLPGETKYYEVKTGNANGIQGGIGSNPMDAVYVTVYAESSDLQGTLDKASELGGKTILPPVQMGGGPAIAMLSDPEGHMFGIYTRPTAPR